MLEFLHDKSEKKVEYIELIYDLMFVYMIGRNNGLLEVSRGFFSPGSYLTYFLATLVVLQIWYSTTVFVNHFGGNGPAEYVGIFVNMYLLYFMGQSTREHWQAYFYPYNIAWILILLNLAVQYALKLRKELTDRERRFARRSILTLLVQAGVILLAFPVYALTGRAVATLAVPVGLIFAFFTSRECLLSVDFSHLSERVMLYVVFTFGEMLIAVTRYFSGGFTRITLYYSLMAFLIVAGLFTSYGYYYDHLIDREKKTTGTGYMFLHIFMLLALGNITIGLEFMPDLDVEEVPKNILLLGSILLYYLCLLLTQRWSVKRIGSGRFYWRVGGMFAAFCLVMALCYRWGWLSILMTVVFIYLQLLILHRVGKRAESRVE